MAFSGFPLHTGSTWNPGYEIPTDDFVLEDSDSNPLSYSCDFNVDAGANYPQIPPSTWTVTLTVGVTNGKIVAQVFPKQPEETTSSGTLIVECRVRPSWEGSSDNVVKIDPTGCSSVSEHLEDLRQLVQKTTLPSGSKQCCLKPGAIVHVDLAFNIDTDSLGAAVNRTDMKNLLDSRILSDCKLVCQGREFPVHRAILANQSPVFAAMFQNNMEEKSTGICRIDDMSSEVVTALIRFVYTRAELDRDTNLMELWMAADKYDMANLRVECLRGMVEFVSGASVDAALSYLEFAQEHNLEKLRAAAARVVGMHADE
ncbi:uncharacterized protein LOC129595798 [Paramacrobiotus metropolitanus]|uniref:uncharacterized protein LOC129595798 n=1 Tax=Paramacrobiotus metropolitanus TaxID=2943436 RepID=UPI002445B5E7|nr:uncharacterized protein LOC129595798 [Paramacrobiotus metropolitanus]